MVAEMSKSGVGRRAREAQLQSVSLAPVGRDELERTARTRRIQGAARLRLPIRGTRRRAGLRGVVLAEDMPSRTVRGFPINLGHQGTQSGGESPFFRELPTFRGQQTRDFDCNAFVVVASHEVRRTVLAPLPHMLESDYADLVKP